MSDKIDLAKYRSIGISVKSYEHHNKAFKHWDSPQGKYISSKADYDKAMSQEGMVPYHDTPEPTAPPLRPTPETVAFLDGVQSHADAKGNVNLSDREIDFMKSKGALSGKTAPPEADLTGGFTDG